MTRAVLRAAATFGALIMVVIAFHAPAFAEPRVITSVSAPSTVIDFAGSYNEITTQFAAQGVTFAGALIGLSSCCSGDTRLFPGNPSAIASNWDYGAQISGNYVVGDYVGLSFSATFSSPVNQVGFYEETNNNVTITEYNGASRIGSLQLPDLSAYVSFYGVADSTPFDRIVVDLTLGTDGFFAMNDFTFHTEVPESATWALMLIGFAGLGLAGYKARAKRRACFPLRQAALIVAE
jgi:hypothetical protein